MARRRMFTVELLDSDCFTDLDVHAQMLYICLSVHADDEGFLSSGKRLSSPYGGAPMLQALVDAGLVIRFPSGVLAITDWHLNNTIRKDRSAATIHQTERNQLSVIDGRYVLSVHDNQVATNCQPFANHLATQNRIEENRIEKNISDNSRSEYSSQEHAFGEAAAEAAGLEDLGNDASTIIKEPSCTDIVLFCEEAGLKNIDAMQFWSHYYLCKWKDKDGRPIKDWKALARSWDESNKMLAI